jgi:hypothetical protein
MESHFECRHNAGFCTVISVIINKFVCLVENKKHPGATN